MIILGKNQAMKRMLQIADEPQPDRVGAATWVGLAYGLLWLALNGHDYLDKLIKGWLG